MVTVLLEYIGTGIYNSSIKSGQVTNSIIIVKCHIMYTIQVKQTSLPYLISKILVTYNHHTTGAAFDWPHVFYSQAFVCLGYTV